MSADKITPEYAKTLREEATAVERVHGETLTMEWRKWVADQLRAHADALEELAALRERLKAPVDVAGIVEELRSESHARKALGHHYLAEFFHRTAAALGSLAAQLAEREAELAAIKGHAEAMANELELLLDFIHGYKGLGFVVAHSVLDAYRAAFPKED